MAVKIQFVPDADSVQWRNEFMKNWKIESNIKRGNIWMKVFRFEEMTSSTHISDRTVLMTPTITALASSTLISCLHLTSTRIRKITKQSDAAKLLVKSTIEDCNSGGGDVSVTENLLF